MFPVLTVGLASNTSYTDFLVEPVIVFALVLRPMYWVLRYSGCVVALYVLQINYLLYVLLDD